MTIFFRKIRRNLPSAQGATANGPCIHAQELLKIKRHGIRLTQRMTYIVGLHICG